MLAACAGMCFVLGSVHAFSVFLTALETAFQASRASVSLTYSLALVAITVAVSFGHRLYGLLSGGALLALVGVISATGLLIASAAPVLPVLWLAYGVLFGLANGLGYGYGLQLAAQTNPGREGLAMGLVTAAYALGAAVAAPLLEAGLGAWGVGGTLLSLAVACALVSAVAALTLWGQQARFVPAVKTTEAAPVPTRDVVVLWAAYGAAVMAGLMAIGHATGIAEAYEVPLAALVWAPVVLALANMVGSVLGGWLTDRVSARMLLTGLPAGSALALIALASGALPWVLVILGATGFIYGAVISVYPAVIARRFGVAAGVPVYGKVFTAWAVAGLGGPWVAGALYDATGTYTLALALAAVFAVASGLIAWRSG